MQKTRNKALGTVIAALSCALFAWLVPFDVAELFAQPGPPAISAKRKKPKKETKAEGEARQEGKKKRPALDFVMNDIDGQEQDLKRYYGNVVLMVNTASLCGLTPQYEGLQKLYEDHKDRGFVVLGFPANNFGAQEPGTNEEIKSFCTSKFEVTFPMFAKISVKGEDACELYKYLTDPEAAHKHGGEIPWNFTKFLIDRRGKVANRFDPRIRPDDEKFVKAIEKQLKRRIPKDSPLAEKGESTEEKKREKKEETKAGPPSV